MPRAARSCCARAAMATVVPLKPSSVEIDHLADHIVGLAGIPRSAERAQRTFGHDGLNPGIRRHLGIIPDILCRILDRKGKLVWIAVHGISFDEVHHAGLERARGNDVVKVLPRHTCNIRHGKGFGHRIGHRHPKEVVDQFDRVPGPERAKVKDVLAEIVEHRFHLVKGRLVA
mgnify:CR=1 FL=1